MKMAGNKPPLNL